MIKQSLNIKRLWRYIINGDQNRNAFLTISELGWAYYKTGQYKKAKEVYKKAEKDFSPLYPNLNWQEATLALAEGDTIAANRYIEKRRPMAKEGSWTDADFIGGLGRIYSEAGILDKAEKYYRQALTLEPNSVLEDEKSCQLPD